MTPAGASCAGTGCGTGCTVHELGPDLQELDLDSDPDSDLDFDLQDSVHLGYQALGRLEHPSLI